MEGIFPEEANNTSYPKCLAGKRGCPPKDCGGITDYYWIVEALGDPNHPDHKDKIEWLEGCEYSDYKPEVFDPRYVNNLILNYVLHFTIIVKLQCCFLRHFQSN